MHRRKKSKEVDFDEASSVVSPGATEPSVVPFPQDPFPNGHPPGIERQRVVSSPVQPLSPAAYPLPPSAGPYRTSFASPTSPNGLAPPMSPFRASFSHSRTRSTSGVPPSRSMPSPLSGTFPGRENHSIAFPASSTAPNLSTNGLPGLNGSINGVNGGPPSPQARRHARIHSRNLSVFFPRPGTLPHTAIAEDGVQELEYGGEAPFSVIPPASPALRLQSAPAPKRLGEGFTFGARPPSISPVSSVDGGSTGTSSPAPRGPARRGHHHKHSVSHNFFSFLEPGSAETNTGTEPASPWNPISPFPATPHSAAEHAQAQGVNAGAVMVVDVPGVPRAAGAVALVQFALGAALWVAGQQSGSLGCTGLGYWVVFDAFGVAMGHVLPAYLAQDKMRSQLRRPYGNARMELLVLFSQSVYLVFSSVYVCKETVEHLLLSAGEGHHHHRGDEELSVIGIQFPVFLVLITFISLISTSLFYDNHAKLIEAAGHRLPSLTSFIDSRSRTSFSKAPTSPTKVILANPFTTAPLLFTIALLASAFILPPSQHRPFDLLLAAAETVLTFSIAYPACAVLGAVLLQTSPERGLPGGRMESFLRVMREIERHPNVLHLPAPHIWQLTPSVPAATALSAEGADLVVTLELHVRKDLDDHAVLELTRWAHERCRGALSLGARRREDDGADVTVGIVKG